MMIKSRQERSSPVRATDEERLSAHCLTCRHNVVVDRVQRSVRQTLRLTGQTPRRTNVAVLCRSTRSAGPVLATAGAIRHVVIHGCPSYAMHPERYLQWRSDRQALTGLWCWTKQPADVSYENAAFDEELYRENGMPPAEHRNLTTSSVLYALSIVATVSAICALVIALAKLGMVLFGGYL